MGKSLKILIPVTAILIFISIYLIFGYAQIEKSMLEVQKIFYFHVSSALTVFVAFGVNFIFSIKYLVRRNSNDDLLAAAAAEIGLVFLYNYITIGSDLGEICLGHLVELGTQVNQYTRSLADVCRLFYSPLRFGT